MREIKSRRENKNSPYLRFSSQTQSDSREEAGERCVREEKKFSSGEGARDQEAGESPQKKMERPPHTHTKKNRQ